MEFREKINEICRKAESPIQIVITKGSHAKVNKELDLIQEEFLQLLETISIPFSLASNFSETTEKAIEYAESIEKCRKIIELCMTIIDELKTNPSATKLKSLVFAWQHMDALT